MKGIRSHGDNRKASPLFKLLAYSAYKAVMEQLMIGDVGDSTAVVQCT
jgi:hypothetical protein